MSGLFGGGVSMPAIRADQPSRMAEPIEQLSDEAKRNRRLKASILTKDWNKPKLDEPGLLGIT